MVDQQYWEFWRSWANTGAFVAIVLVVLLTYIAVELIGIRYELKRANEQRERHHLEVLNQL